jgi:16S rRNA (cytosine1402-N4)-methyltransferase
MTSASPGAPPPDETRHVPVLLDRVVALLAPALTDPGAVFVDATLGLGGHTLAMLERFPDLRVVGVDRDPDALRLTARRLAQYETRTTLVHAVYDELPEALDRLGLARVQGVLLDLGVSSMQLDEVDRGFSYARDAPLDMRMDPTSGPTAAEIVNDYPAERLARVLATYGEERFARRIADRVVRARSEAPIQTTSQLVELIRAAIPAAVQRTGGHPAKRTFQALRIEVNGELAALERALPRAIAALAVGGRIAVLSYHSLEDRLVKRTLARLASDRAPVDMPVVRESDRPELRLLTRGAERPTDEETVGNPRAASARLRAAERIKEAA